MRLIFVNCIAAGPVDFKRSLTAPGQPAIRECWMIYVDDDKPAQAFAESFTAEVTAHGLNRYSEAIASGHIVVGHSVEYHHGHLRAAMISAGIDPHDGRVNTICTMVGLAGHGVKRGGRNGWPSFQEACDYFQITRAGTETAEDNARCLMQVFRGMQSAGVEPEPRIWKERH